MERNSLSETQERRNKREKEKEFIVHRREMIVYRREMSFCRRSSSAWALLCLGSSEYGVRVNRFPCVVWSRSCSPSGADMFHSASLLYGSPFILIYLLIRTSISSGAMLHLFVPLAVNFTWITIRYNHSIYSIVWTI